MASASFRAFPSQGILLPVSSPGKRPGLRYWLVSWSARRWFEDLFSRGDLEAANEILSADFVDHLPRAEERGLEELKQYVIMYRTPFPDIRDTVEEVVAEGDKVVVRWTSRGIHQGEFMGVAPTGRHATFTGMRLFRIAEKKIAESWVNIDQLGLLEQLGIVTPGPGHSKGT
jgi:predicted ester cyclase